MSNYTNREGGGRSGGHFGGGKPAFGGGGKRFGGKPSFGAKKSWGGDRGGSGPTTMHQANCTVCGKPCEVPFKPMSGKPIYCKEHFISKDGGQSGRRDDRRDDRGRDRFPKRDFSPMHASSGASAPAYNAPKPQFEKSASNEQMTKQLEAVNAKLERLIQAVEALAGVGKSKAVEAKSEEMEKPKKVAKKKAGKK